MQLTTEQLKFIEKFIKDSEGEDLRLEVGDNKLIFDKKRGFALYRQVPVEGFAPEPSRVSSHDTTEEEEIVPILSPSAGIFYRRPEPEAPYYVEEGSFVEAGDTLALIEVMKTYGQVVSDVDGYVYKILVEDGTPVEYGQKLFLIKKGVREQ